MPSRIGTGGADAIGPAAICRAGGADGPLVVVRIDIKEGEDTAAEVGAVVVVGVEPADDALPRVALTPRETDGDGAVSAEELLVEEPGSRRGARVVFIHQVAVIPVDSGMSLEDEGIIESHKAIAIVFSGLPAIEQGVKFISDPNEAIAVVAAPELGEEGMMPLDAEEVDGEEAEPLG